MTNTTMTRLLATMTNIHIYDGEHEVTTRTLTCTYDVTSRLVTTFIMTWTFNDVNDPRRAEAWVYEIDREEVEDFIATCRLSPCGIVVA